jgi:hypothetical protein
MMQKASESEDSPYDCEKDPAFAAKASAISMKIA